MDLKTNIRTMKLKPSTNRKTNGVYISTISNTSAVMAVTPPTRTFAETPSNAAGMYSSRRVTTVSTAAWLLGSPPITSVRRARSPASLTVGTGGKGNLGVVAERGLQALHCTLDLGTVDIAVNHNLDRD